MKAAFCLVFGFGLGVFCTWLYFAITIIGRSLSEEASE